MLIQALATKVDKSEDQYPGCCRRGKREGGKVEKQKNIEERKVK
jgi:hypothetical protein